LLCFDLYANTITTKHMVAFITIDEFRRGRLPAKPGRAVVLRIEPPLASRPFGFHR
jgi:hypothetical protein